MVSPGRDHTASPSPRSGNSATPGGGFSFPPVPAFFNGRPEAEGRAGWGDTQRQADLIRARWRALGHDVEVTVEHAFRSTNAHFGVCTIKSNLVNGCPA